MTIRYTITKTGLLFTADNESRHDLATMEGYYDRESAVCDSVVGNGLEFLRPEQIGALTSAPIFGDGVAYSDDGEVEDVESVFWFPGYCLRDPWEELARKGRVEFTRA